ncbi:basic proline-rich protein-like isoform X1 [Canis lupus familiaris]|uniref:basic proline-rich protein-like isoform X1 n=1 Tax=Canis lupus familiaris TaxID=9615 RepID=UPI0018F7DC02|nr:basic proline-rich protein-like isoform X1 [Canis lupus familiaris]
MRCGSGKGNPWPSPAPPEWSRGPSTHTHSPLVGPGAAGGSWALGAAGARAGSRDPQRPLRASPLSPLLRLPTGPPPRRSWGRPRVASQPWPPLTSAAPLHARPGPPPALHRRAARLRPARGHSEAPGPARPGPASAAPPARPAPVRPEWAAQRGGGVRGASPPRRGHAQHPASRGAAPRASGPPTPGGLGTRRRRRVTLHPYPGPGASGSWSLFQHKGPGATAAALPPPLLRSKPPPQDTLRLRSPERGAEGRPPHPPRPPGPCSPGPVADPGSGRACPTPSGGGRQIRICGGGATRRRVRRIHRHPSNFGGPYRTAQHSPSSDTFRDEGPTNVFVRVKEVFTCGRPGSRNLRRCPTRPAPVGGHRAALSPTPAKYGTAEHPVSWGSVRASGAAPGTARAPRLRAPRPQCGTLSSLHPLASPDRESSLPTRHVQEAGVPTPPRPHHSPRPPAPPLPLPLPLPPSSCPSAGTSPPQICRLPASSGLRTPGARRARPGGTGRGGAAEAAPPTQGGEWSAQHPLYGGPGTQPSSSSVVARLPLWPPTSQLSGFGFRLGERGEQHVTGS